MGRFLESDEYYRTGPPPVLQVHVPANSKQHPMPPGISSKPRLPMAHWMTVMGLRFFFERSSEAKKPCWKDLEELVLESPNAVVGFFGLIMVDIHALSRNIGGCIQ